MVRVNVDNVDVSSGRAVKYSPEVMAKIQEFTTPYFVRTMYNAMVFAGRRQGGYMVRADTRTSFCNSTGGIFSRSCIVLFQLVT